MRAICIEAPAKVNLFLRVLGRRPDGYHDIETLFERVGLYDGIRISPAARISVETDSKEIPGGEKNLAWRAAALLAQRCGVTKGARIRIKKRIPVSAGLGGGSSDAAAVFVGLNRLWRLGLSKKKLLKIGAELGSDVAFFILDTPLALGTGRGERLKRIHRPRFKIWHVLVKPPFGISTAEAYQSLPKAELTPPLRAGAGLTPQKTDVKMLLHSIQTGEPCDLSSRLINSLELSINKRLREILKIKKELHRQGATGSLLCGSGSTVFGIFKSEAQARKAARVLGRRKGWKTFAVSTV